MTDETPCFAAAEGVKLRVITYDWRIKEPLVSLKLLKKSPNGVELAQSIRSILQEDLQLDICNWRAASKDRHATNQAEKTVYLQIFMSRRFQPIATHTPSATCLKIFC
jgi:hypothetical protein